MAKRKLRYVNRTQSLFFKIHGYAVCLNIHAKLAMITFIDRKEKKELQLAYFYLSILHFSI